jgi:hypothetical protein
MLGHHKILPPEPAMISRKQETNHKYMFLSTTRMWWQVAHKIANIKFLQGLTMQEVVIDNGQYQVTLKIEQSD